MSDDHIQTTITTYDKMAKQYAATVQDFAPISEREKFMSLIHPNGKILDAGCGSGRDALFFASRGFQVTGIDLSTSLIDFAKANNQPNVQFRVMDLRAIRLDKSFDGIWACASLLHLKREEILLVLRSFEHMMMPGGTLYIQLKEGEGESVVTGGTTEGEERFFSFYSVPEIRKLMGNAGFKMINQYTWDQKDQNVERPHEVWISSFAKK